MKKKKILSGVFAPVLLATAGFGVHKSMKSDAGLSDWALANVEALAQGEGSFDDLAELCEWCAGQYCHYYITYPDGSGTGWSHWNMKKRKKTVKHIGKKDCKPTN